MEIQKRPVISIDIDSTWTTHPRAWHEVYNTLQRNGFECIFVTGADQPGDKLDRIGIPINAKIIVANGVLKRKAALDAGYEVAIWIDDMPGTIEPCRILTDDLT